MSIFFPVRAGQHDVARGPGLQRAHVAALAGRCRGKVGPDFIERLPDFRQDRFVFQHQQKIAAKTQRQHESGILLQRGADMPESRGAIIEVISDGRIDVLGGGFARRGQRQSSAIRVHGYSLRRLTPRSAARLIPSAHAPASPEIREFRRRGD